MQAQRTHFSSYIRFAQVVSSKETSFDSYLLMRPLVHTLNTAQSRTCAVARVAKRVLHFTP